MNTYSIGVDIGTTSTKAIVFNDSGESIQKASITYPLLTPEVKAAEQDPNEILEAVVNTICDVIKKAHLKPNEIKLLSFSAAMHSLIALDKNFNPLTASITWADQRSEKQARCLRLKNGQSLYKNTGTPIHSMSPLVKLVWLREEKPEIFKKSKYFIGIKEYIFYILFGEFVIDYSIASATGLFNIHTLDWDREALETAQISPDQLPKVVPTTEIFNIREELSIKLGISSNTPVVIGANDGCLANLGASAIEPGSVALTIGTSGAIRTVVKNPITDPEGRVFCYALTDNHWVVGGAVNNGGIIFNWMIQELLDLDVTKQHNKVSPYDIVSDIISNVTPGAEGLLFFPYLSGERAPLWNSNARGSFYGLNITHKKDHMIRAVLEGINLNLYLVYRALEKVIGQPSKINVSGGFAKSKIWRQIVANIFNSDVYTSNTVENSALGAVLLGRYAVGDFNSLEEATHIIKTIEVTRPEEDSVNIYRELIPLYEKVGKLLESTYDEISYFQQRY